MLNDGTKFIPLVREMYPEAYCVRKAEATAWNPRLRKPNGFYKIDELGRYQFMEFIYVIYVPSKYSWSGYIAEIGRGRTSWMAWRDAFKGRVSNQIIEKLES